MTADLSHLIAQAAAGLLLQELLRGAALVIGAAALVHFACMACRVAGHTVPWVDAALIGTVAASAAGLVLDALFFSPLGLLGFALALAGSVVAFQLRLWWRGFHVSKFLKDCHKCS